jgi:predicted RNA-binding Zn ribbon-like protein
MVTEMAKADPSQGPSRAGSLTLVAGELALDFANTISGKGGPQQIEHLREPQHVVIWAQHAKVLTPRDVEIAFQSVKSDPALGLRLLSEAHKLREAIFSIGCALSERRKPDEACCRQLSTIYAQSLAAARLVPHGEGYVWTWDPRLGVAESILGPIAFSALTLLTQQDLSRIKRCEGDHCGWLFFDTTKNKRRRWCEMSVCGNRAKVRALRQRRRQEPGKAPSAPSPRGKRSAG